MKIRKFLFIILSLIISISFFSGCSQLENNIKIGILMPLTGKNAQFGLMTYNGIKLFIDEYNAVGGFNGIPIECVEYDEEGDPAKAVVGYNFLKEEGVCAIITGAASSTSLAIAPLAYDDGIPLMITTASADEITYNKEQNVLYENIFRVGFTNSFQGEIMAKFAYEQNAKNVAVLFSTEDDYSIGLKNVFIKQCNNLGINVSISENFTMTSVDFQSQLENIKLKNPDLIFVPSYYETVGLIVQQARKMGIYCPMVGTDSWSGITKSVSNIHALENCFYCSSYSSDDPGENSQSFSEKYHEKFGEIPNMLSAGGFDAAKILISAIENAINQGSDFDSEEFQLAIIDFLKQTNIECISGNINFDEHNNPQKNAIIINLQNGQEKFYRRI